jgi:lipopolysaccharide export system permease protein
VKTTLYRYIVREIWPTFLACMAVSVFIILATKMLKIAELVVNQGVRPAYVLRMVLYLLPDIVTFALPAASLMAVLIAFLRFSADNEIIAMKSAGISVYQMLPPVLILSLLGAGFAFVLGTYAAPWGNRSLKDLIFQIAQSKADLGIKERVFCEPFDQVVFFVNHFSPRERRLKDVFVVDRRDKDISSTIVADEGRIFFHPERRAMTIQFLSGSVFIVDKDLASARTVQFKSYDLVIELKDMLAALTSRPKKPKEMTIRELRAQLNDLQKGTAVYREHLIEIFERFAMPVGAFLMSVVGVPLGAQIRGRGRSAGIGISLVLFLLYYICLAGASNLSESGLLPPFFGVWIPNGFLLVACLFLICMASRERSMNPFSLIRRLEG